MNTNNDIIQFENRFYISVNSTYADDRTYTLNHIDTFGIFDRWGDIKQLGEEVQGIYYRGTRFVNDLEFRINNHRPLLLSSSVKEANEILSVDLTNPGLINSKGEIILTKGHVYIGRSKFIRNGACYEQITFYNYGREYHEFDASFYINADFKDIFEVRGMKRAKHGEIFQVRHLADHTISIGYIGLDNIKRFTKAWFDRKPDEWETNNKAIFRVELKPHASVQLNYNLQFLSGHEKRDKIHFFAAKGLLDSEQEALNDLISSVTTSNEQFDEWIRRANLDIRSLLADTPYGKYPYAGVPWYNTAFGRDGIITALQLLWVSPQIARDVLMFLAKSQATESDPYRQAEPGKIIHEVRNGEMAVLNEVPFGKYYGSVDATPLFVVLAGAYYHRTNDGATIKKIWPNITAALDWIDKYGDKDGDGYVDYKNESEDGLVNQGWKDSHDSISHKNGELATAPVALCEVQGYVYDAKIMAAEMATSLGYHKMATGLWQQAGLLKEKFNKDFWDEEMQCYVLALDDDKRPCRVVSSNAGHCLYSGIADEDKAVKVAKALLADDMFSGWGIRTLSSKEKRYNPMSYHNGSVWPHDNSIIAVGFSAYGLEQELQRVVTALFEASLYIEVQRLPELFCGFERRPGEGPTGYPVACSPQAWSVAAVFMLVEACLGIEIDAKNKRVIFHRPAFPQNVEWIRIEKLRLGTHYACIELRAVGAKIMLSTETCPKGWDIIVRNKDDED